MCLWYWWWLGSVSDCLGGRVDATTKEGIRWAKVFFMTCSMNFFFIGEKNIIIFIPEKDTRFSKF